VKLERAVLREVRLRLREPFETSHGRVHDRPVLLLTLHSEGLEAWGECVALAEPSYTAETTDTAWDVLNHHVLPHVVGREVRPLSSTPGPTGEGDRGASPIERLVEPARWIRGHPMALATVEMAAWDLAARADGVSLSDALGGTRERVPAGISLGLAPSVEALIESVDRALADGYARVKLKIAPGRDTEVVGEVRARFPEAALSVDANCAYALADAPRLTELDALHLEMLEQPLAHDDLVDHARLQELMRTPICLDESIDSEGAAAAAIELGSCRVLNLKPGRVGGYAASVSIHDLMVAEGIPVWCGGMLETGVGRAHNLALASLPGFTLPGDLSASRRYWERDIVSPEHEVAEGHMRVPTGPGIGVEVDVERIEDLTVRKASFG
jgi:O-succinylbenzoate synthase